MDINGKTKVFGIFGLPVEHSLSPAMHNAAFSALGMDCCYVAFPVGSDMLGNAVNAVRALNLGGVNITVPHKENVIPFLDALSEEASFMGAVNTIKNEDGRLTGHNTDGRGFMRSLSESGIPCKDRKILMIGAGGAARAVGYHLCRDAETLYIYNRGGERGKALAQALNNLSGNVRLIDKDGFGDADFIFGIDIIVNTTPLGLKDDDPMPMDMVLLKPSHTICDLIYKDTPMLRRAAALGCKTLNGKGMLLWQGVLAFEIWTGVTPPVDVMRKALG
jgi:shikimate dehydrogenase